MKSIAMIVCLSVLFLSITSGLVSGEGARSNNSRIYSTMEPPVSANYSQTDLTTQKISRDLRVQVLERPAEDVTVLVQLKEEEDLDYVASSLRMKGGVVMGTHRIGDVIVVDIPADKIGEIAGDSSVTTISPNRVYRALLQDSVPQINAPTMWEMGYEETWYVKVSKTVATAAILKLIIGPDSSTDHPKIMSIQYIIQDRDCSNIFS